MPYRMSIRFAVRSHAVLTTERRVFAGGHVIFAARWADRCLRRVHAHESAVGGVTDTVEALALSSKVFNESKVPINNDQ